MTREFAEKQIEDLTMYLETIKENYQDLVNQMGINWVERKVHEILDELQFYKEFLRGNK